MTIKDIAKACGVSVSTVSRVLNNHPDVSQSVRERVQAMVESSGYIPNNSARILKQSNTKNIGILVKGVTNPFFSEILKYICKSSELGIILTAEFKRYGYIQTSS